MTLSPIFTTFERKMTVYEIDTARWAYKLAPQLTGKAQQAYTVLDPDEAQSDSAVKVVILHHYNINEETYREQFRGLKYKAGLAPQSLPPASRTWQVNG